MTLASANIMGSDKDFFFFAGIGHLCILLTVKVQEVTFGELCMLMYPSHAIKFTLAYVILFQLSVFCLLCKT